MSVTGPKLISPLAVRFTKQLISNTFADGWTLEETTAAISSIRGIGKYDLILTAPFSNIKIVRQQDEKCGTETEYWASCDCKRLYCLQKKAVESWPQQVAIVVDVLDAPLSSSEADSDALSDGKRVDVHDNGFSFESWYWKDRVDFVEDAVQAVKIDGEQAALMASPLPNKEHSQVFLEPPPGLERPGFDCSGAASSSGSGSLPRPAPAPVPPRPVAVASKAANWLFEGARLLERQEAAGVPNATWEMPRKHVQVVEAAAAAEPAAENTDASFEDALPKDPPLPPGIFVGAQASPAYLSSKRQALPLTHSEEQFDSYGVDVISYSLWRGDRGETYNLSGEDRMSTWWCCRSWGPDSPKKWFTITCTRYDDQEYLEWGIDSKYWADAEDLRQNAGSRELRWFTADDHEKADPRFVWKQVWQEPNPTLNPWPTRLQDELPWSQYRRNNRGHESLMNGVETLRQPRRLGRAVWRKREKP
mmetsp:Transcript_113988/g.197075  ORF Transcript_113988/g.197075 Transcript_113988/m.197075 type:complete len:476 (-) Transcript_113988:151-1578(-)